MKKYYSLSLLLLITLFAAFALSSCGEEPMEKRTLYVYNWGEYISDGSDGSRDVNYEFEQYCKNELHMDVTVNYSTFSSNESMYSKISSGSASYDVIIPSDYMIERMVKEDLLLPLDLSEIPNYQYIDDAFKGENIYYECNQTDGTVYSVPYFYGMVGIIYNTSIVKEGDEQIGSWDLMWDAEYKGDILQFNNSRDAFGTALYKLGYDVNQTDTELDKQHWREALDLLVEQKEIVQGYVMDEIFNKMQSGSAAVAAYYAGDYLSMYEDNSDLAFFYPKEGTNSYVDAMCVPKDSKNADLAMKYINFMCEEEYAVANATYTYYASPLTTVRNSEKYQAAMSEVHEDANEILYGEMATTTKTQPYLTLSDDGLSMLNLLWEELKGKSSIGTGIYIGCGVILGTLAILATYQIIKKRRWAKLYN